MNYLEEIRNRLINSIAVCDDTLIGCEKRSYEEGYVMGHKNAFEKVLKFISNE